YQVISDPAHVTENTQSGHFLSQYITGNTTFCGPVFRAARYNQLTIKGILEIACLGMMFAHRNIDSRACKCQAAAGEMEQQEVVDTTYSICHIL
ncbi:MAG: hypothetical protein KAT27_03645, partial [Desulfobacterales bacterium]|nr:hypothetical protein [Desulfobacterales bacterium]